MTDQIEGEAPKQESIFEDKTDQSTPKDDSIKFDRDDLTAVLKQNHHAQEHIKRLEEEAKVYRAKMTEYESELSKAKTLEEMLEGTRGDNSAGPETPQVDTDAIVAQLKHELRAAEQEELEKKNLEVAEEMLKQNYGTEYQKYVDERAAELGLDKDRMTAIAKTSPKAFAEMFNASEFKSAPTQGSVLGTDSSVKDVDYSRVGKERWGKGEDAREARARWNDDSFQKNMRAKILQDAQSKGSTYGNQI